MKLAVSALFLKKSQVGGTEYMLKGLLDGLANLEDIELFIFIYQEQIDSFSYLLDKDTVSLISVPRLGSRFISETFDIPKICHELDIETVIFPNYFTPPNFLHFLQGLRTIHTITVIHDLNYLYFPKVVSLIKRCWLRISHHITLKDATAVVAISDFVKRDIIDKYNVSSITHISTIYNAISWNRFSISTPPFNSLKCKFILTVAYQYRHKNLATLVKAFSELSFTCPNLQLVLVGQLTQNIHGIRYDIVDDIPNLVAQLNLTDKVTITGYINDRELSWYYHHATVFAFPSVFEGFGMPPVEALGMGLPVLTTRCTAIPEVTLGLANYVDDPFSVSEWAEKLKMIVESTEQFTPTQETVSLIRATYNPKTIARQYINLIQATSKNR